jgi:hypothetical protein
MTASHTEPETGESSPTDWRTIGRPGYVGKHAREVQVELDARHGAGRWRIAYEWDGRIISRDKALELYADAYRVHLEQHPDVLNWLIATARDVYDLEPRDVESKLDFSIQLGKATHLQDIAVRRAVAARSVDLRAAGAESRSHGRAAFSGEKKATGF